MPTPTDQSPDRDTAGTGSPAGEPEQQEQTQSDQHAQPDQQVQWPQVPAAVPAAAASRRNKTMRDMALSMGLLAVVVIAFVAINGGLSFSPGRAMSGPVPTADAVKAFRDAGRVVAFQPRVPTGLPADWQANSADVTKPEETDPGRPLTVRGGWIVDGRFVTLVASNAPPITLLRNEFAEAGPDDGTVEAGGATWTVTTGVRSEVAWFRVGPDQITYLITGSADEAAFRRLAESIAG